MMDCANVSPVMDGWQWIMAFMLGGIPLAVLLVDGGAIIPRGARIAMVVWAVLWLTPGLVKTYLYMVLA